MEGGPPTVNFAQLMRHRITAARPDEANNASSLEVSVKGNKVTNGDFSEPNGAGDGPQGSRTSASSSSSRPPGGCARADERRLARPGSCLGLERPRPRIRRQPIGSGLPSTGQRKSAAASRTSVSSPLATYACSSDQLVTRVEASPPVQVAW